MVLKNVSSVHTQQIAKCVQLNVSVTFAHFTRIIALNFRPLGPLSSWQLYFMRFATCATDGVQIFIQREKTKQNKTGIAFIKYSCQHFKATEVNRDVQLVRKSMYLSEYGNRDKVSICWHQSQICGCKGHAGMQAQGPVMQAQRPVTQHITQAFKH